MARKSKKKKSVHPEDLLAGKGSPTARDLVRAIHRINPTKEGVEPKEASDRYRLKAGLQSLLIRRFGEGLILEQPDADQPNLIGIRLRNFDEDACHAMIHELDEDARSWAQRRIDEWHFDRIPDQRARQGPAKEDPGVEFPEGGPAAGKPTVGELLQLGKNALAQFDYERSRAFYHSALAHSKGGLEPALALLELLIDHLAAYEEALALSDSFSSSTRKDQRIRIQLAIACARLNRIESALAALRRSVAPEAAEVYYLAAKHFIAGQDDKQALDQMTALKACGSPAFLMETDLLENEIRMLQARRLKPLEEQMHQSWQQGAVDEACGLADRLLSLMPENQAAQRILREREKMLRRERIAQLRSLAEEARAQQDFGRQADCLSRILAMGESDFELKRLLAEAQESALRQQETADIEGVAAGWSNGEREKALLSYAGLKTSVRERILERIQDRHFVWMEQALAAAETAKPLKRVQAVLTLGRNAEALRSGEDPGQIISQLRIHEKILKSIPQAGDLLQQAESERKRLEIRKRKRLLKEAEFFLAAENLDPAGERIEQIKGFEFDEADRKRFEILKKRFVASRKIQRVQKKYQESVDRGDAVAGRESAARLARLLEGEAAERWAEKVEEQTDAVRKQWCLSTVDLSELPGCYGPLGISPHSEEGNCLLLPDGRHILMVSAHERWVFLRAYDINARRFDRGYLLRIPREMDSAKITPDNDTLWVYDMNGLVVQARLDPLDILFWQDFGERTAGGKGYEDALLCPQSRLFWLRKGGPPEREEDTFEIVHIDRGHSVRRIRSPGYPIRLRIGGKYRMVLPDLLFNSVHIYSENGRLLDRFLFDTNGSSHHAAIHPNGTDFVFLPFDDSDAPDFGMGPARRGDGMLVLEVRPDPEKKHKPTQIPNSDGEALHGIATSLDRGILFVHFYQDGHGGLSHQLTAWKPSSDHGFTMVFRVPVPKNFMLVRQESMHRVAAVGLTARGIEARLLDERPPGFSAGPDDRNDEMHLPSFEPLWMCASATGPINAASLALTMQLQNIDADERRRMIREMKKSGTAHEIAGLVSALDRLVLLEEGDALKQWMREKYPGHFRVGLEQAEEACRRRDWPRVIELLERMPLKGMDDGSARHRCHLLGLGYFIRGEVEKALGIWKEGLVYEDGRCELESYIQYAEIALLSPESRIDLKEKSPVAKMFSFFEQVDRHLAHGQWEEAVAGIESAYPLTRVDRPILARLAEAYLRLAVVAGDRRWAPKVLALAHFLEVFKDPYRQDPILPPFIEAWTKSRMEAVAREAKDWLDNCGRFAVARPA